MNVPGEPIQHAIRNSRTVNCDLTWVEMTKTTDAINVNVIDALEGDPQWRLIGVGIGSGGQTTLTYGWPWQTSEPGVGVEPVSVCKTCKGVGWVNRCESFNFGCEHCPPCPDCTRARSGT
jgi:hypothetical protein